MLRIVFAGLLTVSISAASVFAAERPTEVMHFWVSGSERASINVLQKEFTSRGGTWIDNPQKSNLELRRVLADRLTTGTAPTALQWQGGAELRELAEIGMIDNYDALAAKNHWDDVIAKSVQDRIKYGGHYFLAPTGVHSENWIFYNRKILQDHGLRPPQSLIELLDDSTKLEASGITPISLGKTEWEARVIFISVLMSVVGTDDFRRLVEKQDISVLDKPKALDAIKMYYALARHLGPDAGRPAGWAEATAAVGVGQAAFVFQGDWAKGELKELGYQIGVDFGCMLVPGTEKVLSTVVDTFAFPRSLGVTTTTERDKLIETMLDPAVQVRFNQLKGSIPVRVDIPDKELDVCAVTAEKLLQTPGAVMSQPVQTMSTALVSDLHVVVSRMTNDRAFTPEQALESLKDVFRSAIAEAQN